MVLETTANFTEIPPEQRNDALDKDNLLIELLHEHGRLYFHLCPDDGVEATEFRDDKMWFFRADSQSAIEEVLPTLVNTGWIIRLYNPDLVTERLRAWCVEEGGIIDPEKRVTSKVDHKLESIANELGIDESEYYVSFDMSDEPHIVGFRNDITDEWNFGLFAIQEILMDAEDLDAFIEAVGGVEAVPTDIGFTVDDEYTRGADHHILAGLRHEDGTGFDCLEPGGYGLITEIEWPYRNADIIVDFRHRK